MSKRICTIDFETRSPVDLRKTGTYVYAQDRHTEVWCAAYAFDEGPVSLWTMQDGACPRELREHVESGGELHAWNAAFERIIWRGVLHDRYGWPLPKMSQWRCDMVCALAMSLPGSLENAAAALGLSVQKDMAGHSLMMRMARPRKRNEDGSFTWWDDRDRLERLWKYCETDIIVERELHRRLLPLRPLEQKLWHLDQQINDAGVYVDVDLCERAQKVVAQAQAQLNQELSALTGHAVSGASKVKDLLRWLETEGVKTDSVDKETVDDLLLRTDLSERARRALEIRREASKTSVSKISALLAGRSRDGRARGMLQFNGASTGRWAGRRFQIQNIKRSNEETDVDAAIEAIKDGAGAATIEALFGPALAIVGDTLRGMISAAPSNKIIAADYSAIEGRVLPWLAGEQWKLDAYRAYDEGRGPDLYITSYCKTFNVPVFDKKDPRRQLGKVMELASGFQGGHGAYLKMGAGKKLDQLVDTVRNSTDPDRWEEAAAKHKGNGFGLTLDEWTALRLVIDGWRAAHPRIYRFWFDLEDAARQAVLNPGKATTVGRLAFKKAGSFLFLRLPSGRCLCYAYPRIDTVKTPWGAEKDVVIYKGTDSRTGRKIWGDIYTYGGLFAENVTQAVARDLLAEAMPRVEKAGYRIVAHVHDELIAEVPVEFGNVKEFESLMAELPEWADGLPVAAAGWEGKRYRK